MVQDESNPHECTDHSYFFYVDGQHGPPMAEAWTRSGGRVIGGDSVKDVTAQVRLFLDSGCGANLRTLHALRLTVSLFETHRLEVGWPNQVVG